MLYFGCDNIVIKQDYGVILLCVEMILKAINILRCLQFIWKPLKTRTMQLTNL